MREIVPRRGCATCARSRAEILERSKFQGACYPRKGIRKKKKERERERERKKEKNKESAHEISADSDALMPPSSVLLHGMKEAEVDNDTAIRNFSCYPGISGTMAATGWRRKNREYRVGKIESATGWESRSIPAQRAPSYRRLSLASFSRSREHAPA